MDDADWHCVSAGLVSGILRDFVRPCDPGISGLPFSPILAA